jgi:hypothetical protein
MDNEFMDRSAITDVAGIEVGHFTDLRRPTGCTVVMAREGAIAGVDVRGAAPGTRETDLLAPTNLVEQVHAILLAGGSAFGLDAATGVVKWLEEQDVGFAVGPVRLPLVPGAVLFDFHRLPELFSGHPRDDDHPFPALYPNVNSPQAWSASTVFLLLQALLGLYPYAPLNVLLVDPHLPEWLPEYTLHDLRVGKATVTLRFRGRSWEIVKKEGKLHVVQQPLPWSLTATKRERLFDLMKSLVK